ncbi:1-deoxy-D-xylulose-5-phosphate synthase [Pelagicoccus sp. NFK12]|uniref:1-deoxy-D-xylulose-5-phosphate synthase n=1 Tax=Pelagicoccus enzymogenes TaxID=2773457 RepID=A0A927IH67_9BACT|nr:1-deoxy-D-xylulose-5-phosphate synthase [Pelagicoccus enzymogenes]MBD5779881.1 1-deoxy-D-xylulose-5-phosphate synthase [Pelagicoccus enzymogenes]MDQ8200746.1 1-deoxy-D-xylulose-5-phosphate synthase [Pelagicoccus enzymogenes]
MNDDTQNTAPGDAYPLLSKIQGAAELRELNAAQLEQLAQEIRDRLIQVTSVNGGHLGPNLGVVELSIALHLVFNTPQDQFVFDTSHQGYVHKLLTGRNGPEFEGIRSSSGLSGFLSRDESEHDAFGAGHAGTALSAALGMATARDALNSKDHVVAVCGDAAFTCGITMEALNNVAESTKRLIIVLNDNEWSIAKNVGAISRYLNELITNPIYNRLHHDFGSFLKNVPGGDQLIKLGKTAEKGWKSMMVPSSLFEKYGVRYLGPIDGHDLPLLKRYLEFARDSDEPVIVHVVTKKGKGYKPAIDFPERFHGTSPFAIDSGKSNGGGKPTPPNYQDVFGKAMVKFAQADKKIVGITGAMPSGTGLIHLSNEVPDQFYDVGIAEEHAVLFAAGMATRGLRPVCGIYSTFLQRAFDQIIHDVCLQKLPVVFCMDRAGLSPNDGATHHGLFDIAYLRMVPNLIAMQPKDEDELVDMMQTALSQDLPAFIRYPRGAGEGVAIKDEARTLPIGKAEILADGRDVVIWALGPMIKDARRIKETLEAEDGLSVAIVNARFVKPLDTELLLSQAKQCKLLVTMEDGIKSGGFGSAVAETLSDEGVSTPLARIAWPDEFVGHGDSVSDLRARHGLSPEQMLKDVRSKLKTVSA